MESLNQGPLGIQIFRYFVIHILKSLFYTENYFHVLFIFPSVILFCSMSARLISPYMQLVLMRSTEKHFC